MERSKALTSLRAELSIMTDGLTGDGGIGSACRIIQSGRAYFGFSPKILQSLSLILLRIFKTWSQKPLV
jgi:hypothetical protein